MDYAGVQFQADVPDLDNPTRPIRKVMLYNNSGSTIAAGDVVQADYTQTTEANGKTLKPGMAIKKYAITSLGRPIGAADKAIPDNEWGPVQVEGPDDDVAAEDGVTGDLMFGSTTTAGRLDCGVEVETMKSSLLYAAVAASAAITGTTETDTAFDKSYDIPANMLEAGDIIRIKAQGIHTATTGVETHDISLKLDSTVIESVATIDPANNDIFRFDIDITFRTVGATGTMVAHGTVMGAAQDGAGDAAPCFLASTTVDTTQALTVAVYIDRQAAATDSDSARLDILTVELIKNSTAAAKTRPVGRCIVDETGNVVGVDWFGGNGY